MAEIKASYYKLDALLVEEDFFASQVHAFRHEFGEANDFETEISSTLIWPILISDTEQSYFKDNMLETWDDFALEGIGVKIKGLEVEKFLGNFIISASVEFDESFLFCLEAIESVFNQHRRSKEVRVEKCLHKIEIVKISVQEYSSSIIDRASQFFVLPSNAQLSELVLRKKLNNHGWQNSISLMNQL